MGHVEMGYESDRRRNPKMRRLGGVLQEWPANLPKPVSAEFGALPIRDNDIGSMRLDKSDDVFLA